MKSAIHTLLTAIVMVLALPLSSHAAAQSPNLSGMELFKKCNSTDPQDIVACNMYIIGVMDDRMIFMDDHAKAASAKHSVEFCDYARGGTTVDEIRKAVIVQIAAGHETYDDIYGGIAVVDALKNSFPCLSSSS